MQMNKCCLSSLIPLPMIAADKNRCSIYKQRKTYPEKKTTEVASAVFFCAFIAFFVDFFLRPATSTRLITFRNQFFPAAGIFFFVFCSHLFYAVTTRVMKFSSICINYILRLFCRATRIPRHTACRTRVSVSARIRLSVHD